MKTYINSQIQVSDILPKILDPFMIRRPFPHLYTKYLIHDVLFTKDNLDDRFCQINLNDGFLSTKDMRSFGRRASKRGKNYTVHIGTSNRYIMHVIKKKRCYCIGKIKDNYIYDCDKLDMAIIKSISTRSINNRSIGKIKDDYIYDCDKLDTAIIKSISTRSINK